MKKTFGIITAIVISMFVGITSVSAAEKPTLKVKGNYVDNKIGIELRWNEVENADYYRIQRKEASDTKFTTLIDTKVLSSNNYYKGALPTKSGKYTYRIVTKADGNWIYSNKLTVTIKGKSTVKAEEKKPETKQKDDVKKSDEKPKTSFEIANSPDYVFPYQVGDTPGKILKKNNVNLNDWENYTEFYNLGTLGQCTWYADSRFYEIHGINAHMLLLGEDMNDWISNIQNNKIEYIVGNSEAYGSVSAISDTSNIVNQSIAVFAPKDAKKSGHVVFVEYVERDDDGNPLNVYFTEGNSNSDGKYDFTKDGIIKKVSWSKFIKSNTNQLTGYIIPKDYPKN